jgi:GTP-binding protein
MTIKITSASFHACVTNKEAIPNDNLPIIALVGRSNVGKSSLLNTLAQRRELARTSSLPGKTLTINFYLFNDSFYLVDLPGYGYAKASKVTKAKIQAMMNEFFGGCDNLKGVIQVLDIRHKPSALDCQMFEWIKSQKFNYLAVLTKSDKLSNQQVLKMRKQILKDLKIDFGLVFSSKNRNGREDFLDAIEKIIAGLVRKPMSEKKKTQPKGDKKSSASQKRAGDGEKAKGGKTPKANKPPRKNQGPKGEKSEKSGTGQRRRRRRPKRRPGENNKDKPKA